MKLTRARTDDGQYAALIGRRFAGISCAIVGIATAAGGLAGGILTGSELGFGILGGGALVILANILFAYQVSTEHAARFRAAMQVAIYLAKIAIVGGVIVAVQAIPHGVDQRAFLLCVAGGTVLSVGVYSAVVLTTPIPLYPTLSPIPWDDDEANSAPREAAVTETSCQGFPAGRSQKNT